VSIVMGSDGLLHHHYGSVHTALRPFGTKRAAVCGASVEERGILDHGTSPLGNIESRKTCSECLRILGQRKGSRRAVIA
jgi:hypothetical protein